MTSWLLTIVSVYLGYLLAQATFATWNAWRRSREVGVDQPSPYNELVEDLNLELDTLKDELADIYTQIANAGTLGSEVGISEAGIWEVGVDQPKSKLLNYLERLTAIIATHDADFIEPWMDTVANYSDPLIGDLSNFVTLISEALRESTDDLVEHLPAEARRIAGELDRLDNEIRGIQTRSIAVILDVPTNNSDLGKTDTEILDNVAAYIDGDDVLIRGSRGGS